MAICGIYRQSSSSAAFCFRTEMHQKGRFRIPNAGEETKGEEVEAKKDELPQMEMNDEETNAQEDDQEGTRFRRTSRV